LAYDDNMGVLIRRRFYESEQSGRRMVQKYAESRFIETAGATEIRDGHERNVQEIEHRLSRARVARGRHQLTNIIR